MTLSRDNERGEGRGGTLIGLAVVAIAVYLGFKFIPVMVNAYAFRDYVEQEARFAALRNKDEELKKLVLRKAQELDLPVAPDNIKVHRSTTHFDINITYTVPIKTPVYTYNWNFEEESRAPLF
jgi:hypothetical protein